MGTPPISVGWEFERQPSNLKTSPIKFSTTGNYSVEYGREVARSINGFVLLPQDRVALDLSSDYVLAYLVLDGIRYPMSRFVFVEDVLQKGVVLDPDTQEAADLTNVALQDLSTLLIRNDGTPETIYAGFNPSQELERVARTTNAFPVSIEAGDAADTQAVTWDGNTTDLQKIRQLAELAGHREPWLDNDGVFRSVSAGRVFEAPLVFEEDIFLGEAGSVTVTNNYLTVPNRVIVTSNASANEQVTGTWDAPSSWPSSQSRRGYVRAVFYDIQGVYSNADAERVAQTLGQRLTARRLTANIVPTYLLDGPRVIFYDDAYWTVQSWNVSTAPGSLMSFEAEEYFMETNALTPPLTLPGLVT